MSSAVLDASALLAFLHREPGEEVVAQALPDAVMSAVNVAEVGARLVDWKMSARDARRVISDLGLKVFPFDEDQAFASAELRSRTRIVGLSLGDRACLALAWREKLPALTADRAWAGLEIGVEIKLIRGG